MVGIEPSCHTAQVDGYFVEGHVPAADVRHDHPHARPVGDLGAVEPLALEADALDELDGAILDLGGGAAPVDRDAAVPLVLLRRLVQHVEPATVGTQS